jgi:hypothetical protein
MNGDEQSQSGNGEPNSLALAPKPWYRRKWVWIVGVLLVLAVSIWVYRHIQYRNWYQYQFHRPIEVTRGPWRVLDPGQPVEPLKFEVVEEGSGPVVEPGDLIQVSLWWWSNKENTLERRDDDWWIWVGFRTKKETPFYSISPKLVSTFVGLKEGEGIKFLEMEKRRIPLELHSNPFGDSGYFKGSGRGRISVPHGAFYLTATGTKNPPKPIYIPASTGHTVVHIKKVFKGQLRYRTIHLYDGTWYQRCRWWGAETGAIGCEIVKTPREGWYDDARYDGVSADGQVATFQYGPVSTPNQPWSPPGGWSAIVVWKNLEWENLPVGVQVTAKEAPNE